MFGLMSNNGLKGQLWYVIMYLLIFTFFKSIFCIRFKQILKPSLDGRLELSPLSSYFPLGHLFNVERVIAVKFVTPVERAR